MSKTTFTRIVNKHDLEANWIKAVNFTPLSGELIIYDVEVDSNGNTLELPSGRTVPYTFQRLKIGDGVTNVNSLPFAMSWSALSSCEEEVLFVCGTAAEHIEQEPEATEQLEGTGQEYYTMAPSTMSFRSTAPLDEFQEVQVNGETVDPSNYTLEEGSTIVKLSHSYLNTLGVGKHEVAIISDSKTVKGDFTVAAPKLNEYGFYYNQPYYGYFTGLDDFEAVLLFSDENYCKVVDPYTGYTSVVEYSYNNGIYTLTTVDGYVIKGSFTSKEFFSCSEITSVHLRFPITSDDGGFILATELDFVKCDDEYIYYKINDANTPYYTVSLMDKQRIPATPFKSNILGVPVSALGYLGFRDYAGTSFNIPDSITILSNNSFDSSNLTSIELPANLSYIGGCAFARCSKLTSINFRGTTAQWNAIEKLVDWNLDVPAKYVQCSDGQVAI